MADNVLFVGPLDRVLSLKTLPMFEHLSSRELVAIAQNMRERFFPRGSRIVRGGESLSASYLIIDGKVMISRSEEHVFVESGDTIGLLELLAERPFSSDAFASMDTLALELGAEAQQDVWEDHFPVMLQYLSYLARETIQELQSGRTDVAAASTRDPSPLIAGPPNLVERILTLHSVPMLSSKSIDAVAELSGHLTELRVEPGETLWDEGNDADHFWIVLSGHASAASGSASRSVRYGPGSCLGIDEALAGCRHWNVARAEDSLLTLQLARRAFFDVLEDHFPLALHLLSIMANRLLDVRLYRGARSPE